MSKPAALINGGRSVDDILVLAVFGISALLVPVWLLLDWRKRARERAELNGEAFKNEVRRGADASSDDGPSDASDGGGSAR